MSIGKSDNLYEGKFYHNFGVLSSIDALLLRKEIISGNLRV
ncbi:MAG: hypothetical protein PVH61_36145 [Candidatus Aminicenantes bacterium]